MFGPQDRFLRWIAESNTRLPFFPLLNGGSTLVQPVYAPDVGKALMEIIRVCYYYLILYVYIFASYFKIMLKYMNYQFCNILFLLDLCQHHDQFVGKTFEFAGPAEYSYKEVAEFVADVTTVNCPLIDIPIPIAKLVGRLCNELMTPVVTEDMMHQMLENVVATSNPEVLTLADVGVEATSMDKKAFDYLYQYRPGGHFRFVQGYH